MVCEAQQLPIKPERTISFETTEGSYMDVDLSPDGKEIVFTILGDIYKMPVTGGNAIQLTRGLSINLHPVWSPDNRQIAFISDISGSVQLNVMNADGTSQKPLEPLGEPIFTEQQTLTDQNIPCWTPDGKRLTIHNKFYSLTGGTRALPSDITRVINISADYQNWCYYSDQHPFVLQHNFKTGETKRIFNLPPQVSDVRISPDGRWISYASKPALKSDLVICDLRTSKERILVHGVESHYRIHEARYGITLDSRFIFIGYGGKIHKIDVESGAEQVIPFNTKVNVDCGSFNYNTYKLSLDSLQVRYTRSANQSPDGKNLVFSALNKVYIMDLPKGKPHVLADQPLGQYQPVYSPNGKWIAYVTRSDKDGGALWLVSSAGGQPMKLTNNAKPAIFTSPAWSRDGLQIAVLSDTANSFETFGGEGWFATGQLQLISIREGSVRKLVDTVPMINSLTFSPDGKRILYMPKADEASLGAILLPAVLSLDINGKDQRILITRPKKDQGGLIDPDETNGFWQVSVSPDMRYVVYAINEDLFLSPLPDSTKAALINSSDGTWPVIRIAAGGVDPRWIKGGKELSWSYGNKYYSANPREIISQAVQTFIDSGGKMAFHKGIIDLANSFGEKAILNIKVARNFGRGTIAFRDARVISMKGNEVIEHGTIVIVNGRFSVVGPKSKVKIPAGAKIIDFKGKTVIPGLIDIHDHMNVASVQAVPAQQRWNYLANLAYGVTTARDPSSNFDSFGQAELLETGQMIGPRLFTVGMCVNFKLGSYEEALSTVKKRAIFGATYIKQYMQPTRLQHQWLEIASRQCGVDMTNEGSKEFIGDVAMIKDGSTGIEHAPYWGEAYGDVIRFFAKSGVWHTPTLQVADGGEGSGGAASYYRYQFKLHPDPKVWNFRPESEYQHFVHSETPAEVFNVDNQYISSVEARLSRAGGHVAMGAHGNDAGIGSQWETWALQAGGLTNLQALRGATLEGAKALGMQSDLGSIEPGKLADLVILDKNPLDDIHYTSSIKYVMKNGILYDGNTLDEVWPEKKKLPAWRYKGSQAPNNDKEQKHQKLNQNSIDDDDNE